MRKRLTEQSIERHHFLTEKNSNKRQHQLEYDINGNSNSNNNNTVTCPTCHHAHSRQDFDRMSSRNSLTRVPSFYTSRSILNLSGLSVADPNPVNLTFTATATATATADVNNTNSNSSRMSPFVRLYSGSQRQSPLSSQDIQNLVSNNNNNNEQQQSNSYISRNNSMNSDSALDIFNTTSIGDSHFYTPLSSSSLSSNKGNNNNNNNNSNSNNKSSRKNSDNNTTSDNNNSNIRNNNRLTRSVNSVKASTLLSPSTKTTSTNTCASGSCESADCPRDTHIVRDIGLTRDVDIGEQNIHTPGSAIGQGLTPGSAVHNNNNTDSPVDNIYK